MTGACGNKQVQTYVRLISRFHPEPNLPFSMKGSVSTSLNNTMHLDLYRFLLKAAESPDSNFQSCDNLSLWLRRGFYFFVQNRSLFSAAGQGPDCIGVFISSQCHIFRFDGKSWSDSERACSDYTIDGFSGTLAAHLTVVSSPGKQQEVSDSQRRILQFFKGGGVHWKI